MRLLAGGFVSVLCVNTVMAASAVLDPGPGTDYLGIWCGGQRVNEVATGFDQDGNAQTVVKVSTTCNGSGRGSRNQYYLACWTVTFGRDASIVSKQWLATNHWVQGNPAIPCPVPDDSTAVYSYQDGAGNFPATLSTAQTGGSSGEYRAFLDTTCAGTSYGGTVSGTVGGPGEQACTTFDGTAGDGLHVDVAATSGDLVPVQEVRRPDGTVLCSSASGPLECTLDATGLHTVVVEDKTGAGTGEFDLTLSCLTASCGAVSAPHLTVDMAADETPGRFRRTLTYSIAVGNDGDAPDDDVVVEDALPKGLLLRKLTTTQGTCSSDQGSVTCDLGPVAPASSVDVVITAITIRRTGQIVNTACANTNTCATVTTNLN